MYLERTKNKGVPPKARRKVIRKELTFLFFIFWIIFVFKSIFKKKEVGKRAGKKK